MNSVSPGMGSIVDSLIATLAELYNASHGSDWIYIEAEDRKLIHHDDEGRVIALRFDPEASIDPDEKKDAS